MAQFTENICPTVVLKALCHLLETIDKYQHRYIHIDDTNSRFTFQVVKIEFICLILME